MSMCMLDVAYAACMYALAQRGPCVRSQNESTFSFMLLPASFRLIWIQKMLPKCVAATPWSTQCNQSILKISTTTHGASNSGETVIPLALKARNKSQVSRLLVLQSASNPTSRNVEGVQLQRGQIPVWIKCVRLLNCEWRHA